MKTAFKYRLKPTKNQIEKLQNVLDRTRELYNAALQERRDAYEMGVRRHPGYFDAATRKELAVKHYISYEKQSAQLPAIKELREEYKDIYAQILQDMLRRVDKAMKAFFLRCSRGQTPGYPRFRNSDRHDSFCHPQAGFSITADGRVVLSKIGSIKMILHRPITGQVKTCTIKREGEHWYVIFVAEVEPHPLPYCDKSVGVDMGLLRFATLSDGTAIANPRHYRRAEAKLKKVQQELATKQRRSNKRKKTVKRVAAVHRKIARQRRDFLHKESRKLVANHGTIVFEKLQTANMSRRPKPKPDENGGYEHNGAAAKAGLNKSINDAGWAMFVQFTTYKAEEAGRQVLFVNPKNTSQMCSNCGRMVPKDLSERWHSCECGCSLDRDHNAAITIERLGRSLQAEEALPRLGRSLQGAQAP